ncbi:hypothetical protein G6O69_37015 [Pseudenhygromyxa sp. WMMC2535]|uniref:hypothetical protein n=1 Tax=Pseudenhygromyxa sp. WMMC2535 TaxID=2712867 RepID=UPI0015552BBE|nr:hypothetical protein [Pseudenhygromyxa sp. WMMC2535]NVB41601.1 hypothetical protein [Pseudenhygromyxa sp. WMMC2535]NVB43480.1 hypothetical protein [Pseudenhygromyxa sp. WMMC2535]
MKSLPHRSAALAGALLLAVASSLGGLACVGAVTTRSTLTTPSEAQRYVVVRRDDAPAAEAIGAREWARSRRGRLSLWSLPGSEALADSWVIADLGRVTIADKLDPGQLLDALERYRDPLHLVVARDKAPPRQLAGGLDTPGGCSLRAAIGRYLDLDCAPSAIGPLLAEDWVVEIEFYKPGWVRWR